MPNICGIQLFINLELETDGSFLNCIVGRLFRSGIFTDKLTNTAYKAQRKPKFSNICPCTKDFCSLQCRFQDFITLLYVFMNTVKIFVRYELWVNVLAAIFFLTED